MEYPTNPKHTYKVLSIVELILRNNIISQYIYKMSFMNNNVKTIDGMNTFTADIFNTTQELQVDGFGGSAGQVLKKNPNRAPRYRYRNSLSPHRDVAIRGLRLPPIACTDEDSDENRLRTPGNNHRYNNSWPRL